MAPLSALFYAFLLIFQYFIVSLPHHQNDKRYAAKYNRKKARNQLVLAKKKIGMSREDIMKSLKLTSGGKLTEAFNDLISCDFIRKYNAFGNKNNGAMFQLTDLYTLFYLHYTNRAPFLKRAQ